MSPIHLTWYGRCCFLIQIAGKRIVIDPHDTFDGVDMGMIDCDYTLSSSVAHDHGHIGATPKALTIGSKGTFIFENVTITGIESKESRGTPNIIFNIRSEEYSITNFADLGDPASLERISDSEKEVLESTNIAFIRPNLILHEEGVRSGELALRYCQPKVAVIHHFYPKSFIELYPSMEKASVYFEQIDDVIARIGYEKNEIPGYEMDLDLQKLTDKTAIIFSKVEPQVIAY